MEEKELAYYLEDLNRIHDLSLEKLGEWKEKYPYSQVVHFLMAKKHQVEGFVDDMSVYHKASFYAVDRDFLQERMTNSELERSIEDFEPEIISDEVQAIELEGEEEKSIRELPEVSEKKEKRKGIAAVNPIPPSESVSEFTESVDAEELSDFAQWVLGHSDIKAPVKKKKKKKKKMSKLEQKIESSVIKKEEIITETLANILAQQGHKTKAREMYEKLSLIFPEKSSFFALQIEKLK